MHNKRWTTCTLVFTLACAPEAGPIDGLTLQNHGEDIEAALLSSTTAEGEVPSLPPGDTAIGHATATLPVDAHLPFAADSRSEDRPNTLHCASTARRWGSTTLETFLFEAEPTEHGLEVHMARVPVHDQDLAPSTEAFTTLTDFTWNKDRVTLWVEDDYITSVDAPSVEGTQGRLFIGGGHHFCYSVDFVCWDDQLEPRFTYDIDNGTCTDPDGEEGLNPWPIEMIRQTGDAECADLRGVALEEGDYSYPTLHGWNLRGAVLDGASIHFANLWNADLRGADLSGLDMGYAEIDGYFDGFTQLPDASCERFFDGTAFCIQ